MKRAASLSTVCAHRVTTACEFCARVTVVCAVPVDAVWHLARRANAAGAHFLQISTDYVFDGTSPPYTEDSPPRPLSAYGRLKLRGEYAALAAHGRAVVLRVPVLYGPSSDVAESAITAFARNVAAAEACTLDDWQIRVPTYTPDVAATVANILTAQLRGDVPGLAHGGIFHYSSPDKFTRYSVAVAIGRLLGKGTEHIASDPSPPPGAPRPRDAFLDSSKLAALGLAAPCTPFAVGMSDTLAGLSTL